jgi:Autotransporter beta-domain/Cadherin-like beta sandwich domain/IPT/TIG domain
VSLMLSAFVKKLVDVFVCGGVTVTPNSTSASGRTFRLQTNSNLFWQLKKKIVAVFLALVGFNAYGAVTINIAQAGANVVITANGSMKLPSASAFTISGTSTSATSLVNASAGQGIALIISNLNSQPMATFATSCSAGSGVNGLAKFVASGVVTTSPIVVNEASPRYFNLGYTGGINIPIATRDANGVAGVADTTINVISRMTISNKTLAQMGIVDGQSATCTWGGNSIDESIIIQTNGTPSQPAVSSITPNSGTTAGGTSVTISGTNFVGTTGVSFGGTAATGWVVNNAYTGITINTPAHAAGAADVVVTTVGGSATLTGGYTFVTPALPTITSLATTSGPAAGGTSVVITGTNFTGATAVSFGGTAATSYAVNSSTQITATTAAHAAGPTDVVVTTANGTATSAGAYTYVAAPTISTPLGTTSGPATGGTSVVITGTNFTGATAVSFGGTAATSYAVNSPTQITATTAAHAAGATAVAVTTAGGTATSAAAFTYLASTATLQNLSLSTGTLSPTFASGTTSYTASVSNATTSITVTPTVTDSNATVKVNTVTVSSGSASGAIALNVGANTITTVVTAQDGTTTQTYTTTVTRAGANNAALSNLVLSSGTLSPTFAGGTTSYTATVGNATSTITVTPTVSDSNATVKVNTVTVVSGSASGSIALNVGTNTITTVVTAQDGATTQTYTTTVTRSAPASNVATLSAMTISNGTLSPTFASGTSTYTASVTNATASITLTPTVTQVNATITVNSAAVASGSASGAISLSVGSNTITTVVTAQDGTTTQTYTTTVTRAALLAQAAFTVSASPTTLNATTTSSTLSTSGGSGTGAVSYTNTGTCTLSGSTVSAGTTSSETCTVTATKASDGTYAAATATVNITVARRANIAAAATDASVLAIHGAQIMQSQKFVTTQIDNVANHLNGYRNNFNLRPSNFGFGVNIQMPSLGPASQALYKIKDELTPRPEMQAQNKLQSNDKQAGMKKVGYVEEQDLTPYNDYLREEELVAEKAKQKQEQEQKALQEQIDQSQYYAANSPYERENLTYSIWTAGTIDYANYKTGDNKETQNKLTANGLTMGIDYKLYDAAIVGAAVGVGTAWQSAVAINTNLKAKQTAVTGYGMFGFADHWVVEGLMGYGVVDFSGNRTTSDGAAQLGVNRKGETLFSSGTISKMYWVEGYKVTPFARQDVMHINLHSYAETGAADYALGFDGTNFVHTTTSGGLQVSRDIFMESAKLTPTAKIALNRIRTGGLAQNIYYADTGAAGGVYTLNQTGSYMTTQSLGLGLVYTTRAGDGFDLGWQGAIGANQYKMNGLRFAVRFAM